MFFSLIMPEPGCEREAAHERVGGPYLEHQWLWRFFQAPGGTPRDFLFRRQDANGMPRFYVVSKRQPQQQSAAWRVQTRDYAPQVGVGARLHFELRANPVVARKRDGKSARHDVVMQQKKRLLEERGLARWQDWQDADKPAPYTLVRDCCLDWLKTRAPGLGFALDEPGIAVDCYQQHTENNGRLRFSTVDFSGELTVTDPARFRQSLVDGIGHGKAFGCGLLLVRPGA